MDTYVPKPKDIVKKWYLIDAKDQILGRLATRAATLLRGKGKAIFSPHLDTGDGVIVINARKVRFTGNKLKEKIYVRVSGYPGGRRETPLEVMMKKCPEEVIRHAVKGMLPKSFLGLKLLKKLRVYADETHPHAAQMPVAIELSASAKAKR